MTDIVDMASGIEAELLAARLAGINPAIPAGEPGECEECSEIMPRLVDGRCGFCRDGRTPPPDWFDRHPRPDAPIAMTASPQEEDEMPHEIMPTRKIEFSDDALRAIEARANADDTPFKQAAAALVMAGWNKTEENVDWSIVGTDELLDELTRRLAASVEIDTDALDAAVARAEAAEAKVRAMHQALGID